MRKLAILFSIFLFLSFSVNTLTVRAQPLNLKLSEGVYSIRDLKLMENVTYDIQNSSAATVFMIRIDGNQEVMESRRLEPNSIKYNIGPFKLVDKIAILGPSTATITQ